MACASCETAVPDLAVNGNGSLAATSEPDGYPFSLPSLLADYVRSDFTTSDGGPLETNATLRWLNRGLGWSYGFNHDEAKACFQKAIDSDPDGCPMAWWGLAYTSSPNYNKPICLEPEDETSRRAAVRAVEVAQACGSEWEMKVCAAMLKRHVVEGRPEVVRKDKEGREILDKAYAAAMQAVYDELYPSTHDPEIASLTAEAHMQLSPWKLWPYVATPPDDYVHVQKADKIPDLTAHILGILTRAFNDDPRNKVHTGLVHFWIHVWEMSPTPEEGLELAQWMRTATVGGAGHLLHMPSHLDVLTGRYKEAVDANILAWEADQRFLKHDSTTFYTLYIIHDLHLLIYAAMFQANFSLSFNYGQSMLALCTDKAVRAWADQLESYVPLTIHVLIRFGKFREILELPFPEDPEVYCATTASLRYARGIAKAALGDVAGAREEQALFRAARAAVPKTRMHFQVSVDAILAIAEEMLEGEIQFREGRYDTCFDHLRKAVELDDGLNYMEPWGWMTPARHALGALLLAAGRAEQAMPIYRADMAPCKHPDNIWSLRGLLECLETLGPKAELYPGETEEVRRKVERKVRETDVDVKVSCYCRR
ncbi:TPR domain-containing protein [Hyaloraphidium curvatum]|nr:TPR domain-containing protein [Hyaloraphidium curvatum]